MRSAESRVQRIARDGGGAAGAAGAGGAATGRERRERQYEQEGEKASGAGHQGCSKGAQSIAIGKTCCQSVEPVYRPGAPGAIRGCVGRVAQAVPNQATGAVERTRHRGSVRLLLLERGNSGCQMRTRILVTALAAVLTLAASAQAGLINAGFETGDLSGWTTFTTADGTLGGAGVVVVPFDTDGDGVASKSARFRVGKRPGTPTPPALEGGGMYQSVTLGAGTLAISADIAAWTPWGNLDGGLFELLFDGGLVDSHDFGPIALESIERASLFASSFESFMSLISTYSMVIYLFLDRGYWRSAESSSFKGYLSFTGMRRLLWASVVALSDTARFTSVAPPSFLMAGTIPEVESVTFLAEKPMPLESVSTFRNLTTSS